MLAIAAPLNFALNGIIFTIIVTLQQHGVRPGVIGLAETIVGVGGLAGAFVAPALQRLLPFARLIRFICCGRRGRAGGQRAAEPARSPPPCPVALAVFLGPACNAALFGYQAAITPDRLQGRVLSVIFLAAMSVSAAAPLLAGVFVTRLGQPHRRADLRGLGRGGRVHRHPRCRYPHHAPDRARGPGRTG